MIKIGKYYFAEDAIAAIEPYGSGLFRVHLSGTADKSVVDVDGVSGEELDAVLEQAGLIPRQAVQLDAAMFPPEEIEVLRDALDFGYRFAGKDRNGQVYAYRSYPQKDAVDWLSLDCGNFKPRRLHGEFALLSFDDDEPLDLEDLFT